MKNHLYQAPDHNICLYSDYASVSAFLPGARKHNKMWRIDTAHCQLQKQQGGI